VAANIVLPAGANSSLLNPLAGYEGQLRSWRKMRKGRKGMGEKMKEKDGRKHRRK